MTTLDHRCVKQRLPSGVTATERVLDAPTDWRVILANDALAEDAAANRNRWLAKQAARRWLACVQAETREVRVDFDASLTEGRSA